MTENQNDARMRIFPFGSTRREQVRKWKYWSSIELRLFISTLQYNDGMTRMLINTTISLFI